MSAGVPPVGPGDVYQYQGELYNGDPRIAPGLARPIGWRTRVPDGTAGYDKYGPLDTNWVPIGTPSTGVATIAAAYAAGAANRPLNDQMPMVNGTSARFQANSDANVLPLVGLYETGASKPLTASGYPAVGMSLATDLSILIGGRLFNWFELFDPLWNGTFAQLAGYTWHVETASFQGPAHTAWLRTNAFAERSYSATKNWQPQATPAGPLGSGPGTMLHLVSLYNTLDAAQQPVDQLDGFGQNIRQVSPIQNGVIYETATHFSHRLIVTPAANDGVGWGVWDGNFNHGGDVPRAAWSARTVGASAAGDWYLAFSLQDTAGDGLLHDVLTLARTGITSNAPIAFNGTPSTADPVVAYRSALIDLTTIADNIPIAVPQRPGFIFCGRSNSLYVRDGAGTATTGLTVTIGNNATHDNISPSNAISIASLNGLAAHLPSYFALASGGTLALVDSGTAIVAKISAVPAGMTSLHGYFVTQGFWVPV